MQQQQIQQRSLSEFIKALCIQADFKCLMCGRCCSLSDPIAITFRDAERIARHLDITVERFMAKFAKKTESSDSGLSLLSQPCVFYKEGTGCTVHSARPIICRMYPSIAFFFHGKLQDNNCPGMAAADKSSREFSLDSDESYSSLLSVVEAVQAQGIPVNIERLEDGKIELKLVRHFV